MYVTGNRIQQIDTRTSNPVGGTVADRGIKNNADIARERARRCLGRFYNAADQTYNRANDNRMLAEALDSDVQVDQKLKNTMFYI